MFHWMDAKDKLFDILRQGRSWQPGREDLRQFLAELFEERYHQQDWKLLQARPSYMGEEQASYAGWILAENPTSGPYQGTSFVWFPGDGGSVAILVVGTAGFGPDAHILGRPGHRRRLQALARLHGNRLWVKPDPLDLNSTIPEFTRRDWPGIEAGLQAYDQPGRAVIYAAVAVTNGNAREQEAVEDLMDLFAHEHRVRMKSTAKQRWDARRSAMLAKLFSQRTEAEVAELLDDRRFVVLQGPPGTGKTRMALAVARKHGEPTIVQFHPARTYEDFVIGLAPMPAHEGLRFDVRKGDLIRANNASKGRTHVLVIDEINRGDLSRVLGEAIFLFESGDEDRTVELPHEHEGSRKLRLEPGLRVLATLNTADRSIARLDIAIRRRFAFLDMWPDLEVVNAEGVGVAIESFEDTLDTFTEHADEAGLNLVPGHAYFLDPRPDLDHALREKRVRRRLEHELLPLLRAYVDERLLGPATGEVQGLVDRITGRLQSPLDEDARS
jgi:5-methylcytosine-specific restriction protein B